MVVHDLTHCLESHVFQLFGVICEKLNDLTRKLMWVDMSLDCMSFNNRN